MLYKNSNNGTILYTCTKVKKGSTDNSYVCIVLFFYLLVYW